MGKLPIDFTPIDEETENQVLETLYDILENGGKLPADPMLIQLLTLSAVRQLYCVAHTTRNRLRDLQVAISALTIFVFVIAGFITATHPNEILRIFTP